jgi:site-specific recombinase XerD
MPRKAKEQKHKGVYKKNPDVDIYWIRWVDADGKRRSESIGTFGDSVTAIQRRLTEKRAELQIPTKKSERGKKRFKEIATDAIKFSAKNHRDTRNFQQRLEAASLHFGEMIADSIKPRDVREWLEDQAEENDWEPGTFNRYKAAISKAYKLALAEDFVSVNPARLVPQKKENPGRIRFLSEDEESKLRAAIMTNRAHCIFQFDVAINTGMRKGNQFTAEWTQVDFKAATIQLDMTKNGTSHTVHLNKSALESLKTLRAEYERRDLQFPTLFFDKQNTAIKDPRMWFMESCKEAGIEGVTWHTLRHTFASRLVMKGVDLRTVQELMNHKTISMTARYAHLAPKHLKEAVSTLEAIELVASETAGKNAENPHRPN